MTCEEVRISLGVHVLGALDAEEAAEVEAHLETCAECRAELAALSGLPPLLALVSAEDVERAAAPPRAVLDRLVVASARRGRRSRALLALAASVVVAAVGGSAWLSAAQTASQDTAAGSAVAAPEYATAPDNAAGGAAGSAAAASDAAAAQAPKTGNDEIPRIFDAPASPVPSVERPPGTVAKRVEQPPAEATVTASPEARGGNGDMRLTVRLVPHEGGTQVVARVAGVPAGTVCALRVIGKDGTVSVLGTWTVERGEYRGPKMVFEGSTALSPGQIERVELAGADGRTLVAARL
ncbi:zf-HC2 domain-containing protein [Microbispora sp. NBC_01189]|uniref:zf-HC2 domain-containing protein n=1 Tax=Microbispora sp. NBC_01189 TaxID=2903583 RepID=UPI002E108926|nr:zf-HC2 domain-containing protein [Microbispora sp. NBC_01189]